MLESTWQGALIHRVSEFLHPALKMPALNISLDDIQMDEFLLLKVMEEERGRFEMEEAERQQYQARFSTPPPISKID